MSLLGVYDEFIFFFLFFTVFVSSLSTSASPRQQSALVPTPYGRWIEEFSWETKGTEEERQVSRGGVAKLPILSERKEKRRRRCLRWMKTAGMSVNRWNWWNFHGLFKARLKSADGSLFLLFSSFSALEGSERLGLEVALSGWCEKVGLPLVSFFFQRRYCFGYFRGWHL